MQFKFWDALFREGRGKDWGVIAFFSILMVVQVVGAAFNANATIDEPYHVVSGVELIERGVYDIGREQPPLMRWLHGALPYWQGVRAVELDFWRDLEDTGWPSDVTFNQTGEYWKILTLARLGTWLFVPVLIAQVYFWTLELFGFRSALLAGALCAFSPNLLAHAGLATVDFPVTAVFLGAARACHRWVEHPVRKRAAIAGAWAGAAAMTKYSVLPAILAIAVAFPLLAAGTAIFQGELWRRVRAGNLWTQPIAFLGAFLLLIWAAFGFSTQSRTNPSLVDCRAALSQPLATRAIAAPASKLIEALPGPYRDVASGFCEVVAHASEGHRAFLLGRVRERGWKYYFVVVLLVKTTLALLALTLLGAVRLSSDPTLRRRAIYLLAAAGVVSALAFYSKLNIGVRHVLPLYPLMAIVAAGAVAASATRRPSRAWIQAGLALAALHAMSSLASFPLYISYFSEPFRGREHKILGDSNLDWGQDLVRLREFMEQRGIEQISLRYWGTTRPESVGVNNIPFGPDDQPRGWVACSVTHLQGVYFPKPAWLDGREPVARAGRSIWIYYID